MRHLVVFDTNVLVSYLFPVKKITAVRLAVDKIMNRQAVPVFTETTMKEYIGVLKRAKFHFPREKVDALLDLILTKGLLAETVSTNIPFIDPSDKPFYEAAVSSGAWLVTGNKKHYPDESFIVSPREYIERAGL